MSTWANESAFEYARFNSESAAEFIETHFDSRTLAAYRKCAIPAMQADFFRYCALWVHGGVYVDADTGNSGKLPELISGRKIGLLMTRQTRIANDFLFVRQPHAELYEKSVEQAVENVENEISNNVWMVTGPGIMTHMHEDPERSSIFEGYDMEPASLVRQYVLFRNDLEYKSGDQDWRKNLKEGGESIFVS
ncbi:glycosyltransferase [Henriciella sp. AS95]|uniref:glycosyltransferase n=1 Tax=Henriciella sp. AS95 TaxID=3135782 RepID=UPI00316C18B9